MTSNRNEVPNWILAMSILMGLAFGLIVGYLLWGNTTQEQEYTPLPTFEQSDMVNEFRDEFLGGCIEEDGDEAYCQCTWDYLYKTQGYNGILDLSVEYLREGDIPSELMEAAEQCIDLY